MLKLSKINLFIRSLLFSCIMVAGVFTYSFVCLFVLPFPLRFRYRIVAYWTKAMIAILKFLCHIDYQIEGLDNIPKDRNGIVMSKHQSTWETFFLPRLFSEVAVIAKRELTWIPFFGWGLAATSPITINRKSKSKAMAEIISQGKAYLEAGRWVLVFPEGTRVAPGQVGNYRLGGARLAAATGYPIVPIAHNAGRFWPRRRFIKNPGTVKVVIGPLIETEGRKPEDILAETKAWIEATMQRIDAPFLKKEGIV